VLRIACLVSVLILCVQVRAQSSPPVPSNAPDSVPAWLYDDSSQLRGANARGRHISKYTILVSFNYGTAQLLRQAAIDSVRGTVIGGYGPSVYYIVLVPSDSTGALLLAAEATLRRQPQVSDAGAHITSGAVPASPTRPDSGRQAIGPAWRDSVPAIPPDSTPRWFADDSSWEGAEHHGYLKGILTVIFTPRSTRAEKQAAVDAVQGSVIGGGLVGSSWGHYYVQIRDRGSGVELTKAIAALKTLPQVQVVSLTYRGDSGAR